MIYEKECPKHNETRWICMKCLEKVLDQIEKKIKCCVCGGNQNLIVNEENNRKICFDCMVRECFQIQK